MISIFITDVGVSVEDPSYPVDESDGTVEVCVVLTGKTERNVCVTISTGDGSAIGRLPNTAWVLFNFHFSIAPKDYTSTETDLTFTPDNSRICVNIPITNDTVVEGNEIFIVTVTSKDPSIQIGLNSNSTVIIVDDDGMQLTDST